MLSSTIRSKVDQLWDKFWSGGIANPLTAIEQISYLLFLRLLEETDRKNEEDAKFVGHEGFDWEAISKAIEKNEKKGRVVSGASTISQQLAKNLFLSGERSWVRKGQEAVITWMLETALSKRRILELYLNYAEWGEGVFGAEAAARYHFGSNAASLGAQQAAFLAAILPSPRRYAAGRITPYVAGRIETITARMPAAQIP